MGFLPFFHSEEKDKGKSSPPAEPLKSPVAIVEEMDNLYVLIRGALYANGLNDAKSAFQEKNYPQAFRSVRETGELYRRMHLQVLKQEPEKAGGGKKEIQKFRDKQAKIKDVLARFDGLVHQLEKMAKLQPDVPKKPIAAAAQPAHPAAQVSQETQASVAHDAIDQQKDLVSHIIDTGSFTQLQTAAQLTGLLPSADGIGFVRDHEFRTGKYQEAFERIDVFFMHLKTAAEQRQRTLRQDERDYKSGILKMSPKQWLIKQQNDTAQTQRIDRALRYCTRILDGLRIMITSGLDSPL